MVCSEYFWPYTEPNPFPSLSSTFNTPQNFHINLDLRYQLWSHMRIPRSLSHRSLISSPWLIRFFFFQSGSSKCLLKILFASSSSLSLLFLFLAIGEDERISFHQDHPNQVNQNITSLISISCNGYKAVKTTSTFFSNPNSGSNHNCCLRSEGFISNII